MLGVLQVPEDVTRATRERLLRVVPTFEALLAAARIRQNINDRLIETRQRLERFFDLSSDFMVISDQRKLLHVNPAFERILGYPADESALDAFDIFDIVASDNMEQLQEPLRELTEGRGPVRFENRATGRDGSRRWIEWSVVSHQELFYAVGRDITEQRLEQEQLRQTQTMLEASRDKLRELAEHQAGLRRVATLVAHGTGPLEVFESVGSELAQCIHVTNARLARCEDGGTVTILAARSQPEMDSVRAGTTVTLADNSVLARALSSGRPVREDSPGNGSHSTAENTGEGGVLTTIAVPVIVDGRLWGGLTADSPGPQPLPSGADARISDFADLIATAIANTAARQQLNTNRDRLRQLARHQTALRRVAELVAREADPGEVFNAVADEMANVLDAYNATVARFEDNEIVLAAVARAEHELSNTPKVGERFPLDGDHIAPMIRRTGRPARIDSHEHARGATAEFIRAVGVKCMVGVPIVVGAQLWGVVAVASRTKPLPADTESRMADFADLVGTSIANAATRTDLRASRDSLRELADSLRVLARQQAALRRVATLVARGVGQSQVLSAVAEEMAGCLNVSNAEVLCYQDGGAAIVVVASYAPPGVPHLSVGERLTTEGDNVSAVVYRTGQAARMDSWEDAAGSLAERVRELHLRSRVGAPIVVDERMWGMAVVSTTQADPLPADTEARIAEFAELVATGIAAATARADLIASRARIVAAADEARRRMERDIHDGAQQRLISLGLTLRLAEESVPPECKDLKFVITTAVTGLTDIFKELQEISRGIHPAVLSTGGLAAGFKTLARRSPVPVSLDLAIERRLPDSLEVAAYYVVAEALTNAAKHAQASEVKVLAHDTDESLNVLISDDGIGGADSRKGSGLIGLKDRIEVLGGRMRVASPPGGGTSIDITIPLNLN